MVELVSLMSKRNVWLILLLLVAMGIVDTAYLTWEHYSGVLPPCSTSIFVDCGAVLSSKYSVVFGIPLAVYGLLYYGSFIFSILLLKFKADRFGRYLLVLLTTMGFLVSVYLMYLQLLVIGSICLYCTGSALISFILFYIVHKYYSKERKRLVVIIFWYLYKYGLKVIFFWLNPEVVHNRITELGERLGEFGIVGKVGKWLMVDRDNKLRQKLAGIEFENPVGLAAGFDYEAKLTQFLPSLGFGFTTAGTITNMAYEGNNKPRLGRLPKSKSLLVNKGFKSTGAKVVSEKLSGMKFDIPFGISIGRTNSAKLKTQQDSVNDIVAAFKIFEKAKIDNDYYELNISCPNLIHGGDISFYPPKNLEELLDAVDKLKLKKPVFVKMPIEKGDKDVLVMLKIIAAHSPVGVIFGNLQKDKKHPSLKQEEVRKFKQGFYSGKPTYERSNELISLVYKHYKDRFVIVGCGGVFSGEDAYEKISRGASLIQLITGLVYEGPQLIQQINFELSDILKEKGFKHISEAVGSKG